MFSYELRCVRERICDTAERVTMRNLYPLGCSNVSRSGGTGVHCQCKSGRLAPVHGIPRNGCLAPLDHSTHAILALHVGLDQAGRASRSCDARDYARVTHLTCRACTRSSSSALPCRPDPS